MEKTCPMSLAQSLSTPRQEIHFIFELQQHFFPA